MNASLVVPRRVGEVVCLLTTAVVPLAGYAALYGDLRYLPTLVAALGAGVIGVALAMLVASFLGWSVTRRRGRGRLAPVGATLVFAGVTVVAWSLVRPHPGNGNLIGELTHGLSAILTLNQPVDVANDVMAIPFFLTAVTIGLGLLSLRSHSLLLPLLPTGVALAVQLLLCAGYNGPVGVSWGVAVFTAAAVLLVGFRRRNEVGSGLAGAGSEGLRLAAIAVVVAVVAGAGAVAVAGPSRFDPRDRWHPADVDQRVTPLAFVRSDLTGPDDARFSIKIAGAGRVQRVAVARLDVFDGTVWTTHPRFRMAGRVLRPDSGPGSAPGIRADVEVIKLPNALLPQVGPPVRLQRYDSTVRGGSVLLDRDSGMLLARSAPTAWRYTLLSTGIDGTTAADTTGAMPTTDDCRPPADDPQIAALRRKWLPQKTVTSMVLNDLAIRMRAQLPYNPIAPAGSSLAAIERVLSGVGPDHVGYAEQHAAAFSFLACAAGSPARVVVGYRLPRTLIPGVTVTVTAHDAHAWSEVYIAGTGWMTFDPTDPDKPVTSLSTRDVSSTPQDETFSTPPPTLPALTPGASSEAGSSAARAWSRAQGLVSHLASALRREAVPVLAILLAVIAAGLLGLLGYRMLVAARRRREQAARYRTLWLRRSAPDPRERVLGAWAVTTQLCRERGLPVRASFTPEEVAAIARGNLVDPTGCMSQLVALANAALFGPDPSSEAEADRAWLLADELLTAPARRPTVLVGGLR